MLVLNKFFKRIKDKPDVVHERKKYQRMWHLWSGDGDIGHWIILCGGVQREALGRMKVQLVKKKKLLLSNEFLSVLFTPIVESLRELYVEIGKF